MKYKVFSVLLLIVIYLFTPFIITMVMNGKKSENINSEIASGKTVTVKYKTATQTVDINKFIINVLAYRLDWSDEIEIVKAQSIMIRTDIYRIMGNNNNIDSTSLNMQFLNDREMKSKWGNEYDRKYNLLKDCVASTDGIVMKYNNNFIDCRYTKLSNGKTLSGAQVLGADYAYLNAVECPLDLEDPGFLAVKQISYKDFTKKLKAVYPDIGIDENNPYAALQIVSKTSEGYILKLQVGNAVMSGTKFAEILEVNSACMQIENVNNEIRITTKGMGDGFGVSLYTADKYAKSGLNYEQILTKFYTGITFSEI